MQTAPEAAALAATLSSTLPAMPDGVPRALVQLAVAVLTDRSARAAQPPAEAPTQRASAVLTTAELAAALGREQSTIRRRLCETGSYFGLTPTKLPSGRLLWPADSLAQLSGNVPPQAVER